MIEKSRRIALTEHAEIRARLRYSQRRDRVLVIAGVDDATWSEEDAAWTAHIEGSIARGDLEDVSLWQERFASTKSEIEAAAEARRLAAIEDQPAPSAPVSAPAPVQQVASFMYPRSEGSFPQPVVPQPVAAPLPVVTRDAPPRMGGLGVSLQQAVVGPNVPVPPAAAAPARMAPTETLVAGDGPLEPVLPFQLVEEGVSLELYASISAELAAAPNRRLEVLRRHGFTDEAAFERVRAAWKRRMADAAISGRFMGMFVRFRDDLQTAK